MKEIDSMRPFLDSFSELSPRIIADFAAKAIQERPHKLNIYFSLVDLVLSYNISLQPVDLWNQIFMKIGTRFVPFFDHFFDPITASIRNASLSTASTLASQFERGINYHPMYLCVDQISAIQMISNSRIPIESRYDTMNTFLSDPVEIAIINDDVDSLGKLASDPQFSINRICQIYNRRVSAISLAALTGSIMCFRFYLFNKAEISQDTMSCALAGGSEEIIQMIIEMGFDPLQSISAVITGFQFNIFTWLLDQWAGDPSLLMKDAVESGNIKAMAELIKRGGKYGRSVDQTNQVFPDDWRGEFLVTHLPIYCVAESINSNFPFHMLTLLDSIPNGQFPGILERVICYGKPDSVEYLLSKKPVGFNLDNYISKAIHSLSSNVMTTISLLVDAGARCSEADVVELMKRKNQSIIVKLLQTDVSISDSTLLANAARDFDNKEIIDLLVGKGCNVDVLVDEMTPLMLAAQKKHFEAVRALLANGANKLIEKSAFEYAVSAGVTNSEILTALFDRSLLSDRLINSTVEADNEVALSFLLQQSNVSLGADPATGNSPLHLARSAALATLLINLGANMNVVNKAGETPLHTAIRGNRGKVVEVLVKAGADPSAPFPSGETPLQYARNHDRVTCLPPIVRAIQAKQS